MLSGNKGDRFETLTLYMVSIRGRLLFR